MNKRMDKATTRRGGGASVLLGAAIALWAGHARASGISTARFGGEHGHPTTDNPTAIYYNPAGIALSKGTHFFIDGTFALRWASYNRPALSPSMAGGSHPVQDSDMTLSLARGANDGKATLFNAVAAPFLGASSDFGTDFIYAGAAFYVPFGGSATWDKNPSFQGSQQFPGAVDGVQRWSVIDGTIRSMYITGALAFNIRKIGLSIGFTGSAIRSNVDLTRAQNIDFTDDLVTQAGALKEGRAHVNAKGWQGGFSLGAIYDVLKMGKYFIGLSYTSQPNVRGGMKLKGKLDTVFGTGMPSTSNIVLTQTMPDILRFGFRAHPNDKWEFRIFGDWTRWSVFNKQCILDASMSNRSCKFPGDSTALSNPDAYGSGGPSNVVQQLVRDWKDAGGVRVGASYWFVPQVEGYVGLGYDSRAAPLKTLDASLLDAHNVSVAAGARWRIIKNLALAFTMTEIAFVRTSTKGQSVLNRWQSITRQPSGDGVYKQFFQLFNVYMDISF